jgi:hypothetical protein
MALLSCQVDDRHPHLPDGVPRDFPVKWDVDADMPPALPFANYE